MAIEFNAKLASRIDYTNKLSVFKIKPNDDAIPDFKPGQYVLLGLPGDSPRVSFAKPEREAPKDPSKFIVRAYSIASTPKQKDYFEFNITMVDDGTFTPRLFNLKVGDPIHIGKKVTGHFVIDDAPEDKNVVMVGTGTGLAPFMSMLHTNLVAGSKRKFSIFHGVRTSQELAYRSELEAIARLAPNFSYFPIISRPQEDPIAWHGASGYVMKLWENRVLKQTWGEDSTPQNTHFFLCGSPGMINSMLEILGKDGFKEHNKQQAGEVTVEKYW